jgi:hypothetical protein
VCWRNAAKLYGIDISVDLASSRLAPSRSSAQND